MRLYKFYKNRSWGRPVDRMRMKNGENERLKKADGRRIFERKREKEEKAENFKKDEKSFEKGVAFF